MNPAISKRRRSQLTLDGKEVAHPPKVSKGKVFCINSECNWDGRRIATAEQKPCPRCGGEVDLDLTEAVRDESWNV